MVRIPLARFVRVSTFGVVVTAQRLPLVLFATSPLLIATTFACRDGDDGTAGSGGHAGSGGGAGNAVLCEPGSGCQRFADQ